MFTNAIDGPAGAWATVGVKLVDLAARGDTHQEKSDSPAADLATFRGRFATLWGVFDIVDLGGQLFQLSPTVADPTIAPTRLEVVDADTLVIADTTGFGSHGERVTFERDDEGGVVSVRSGSGTTAYPLDAYRAAVASRRTVTVGQPIVV